MDTDHHLQDTLLSWSRKELELENLSIVGDTLKFITPAKQLYYPFGRFKKVKDLITVYPMLNLDKGKKTESGIDRFVFNHSYVKFYKDDETGCLEIVYAAIIDPGIQLTNNIEVGMTSKQLYNKFLIFQ